MDVNKIEYDGRVLLDLTEDTVTEDNLLSGIVAHDATGRQIEGKMPVVGAVEKFISSKSESYTIPKGYHNGSGKVAISNEEQAKLIASNIKKGITILGVTGTLEPLKPDTPTDGIKTFAQRTDASTVIPDVYNTGASGELKDFTTLYPNASINGKLIYITQAFVNEYGNEIGNFVLEGYGLYFKDPVGNFKISNAKFIGDISISYAIQLTNTYLAGSNGNIVTVENCEASYYKSAFNNGRCFKFIKCYVHDMYQDAFKADNLVTIDSCYVQGCGLSSDSHADGVQVKSTGTSETIKIDITNTRFEQPNIKGKHYENSCVFIKYDQAASGKITLSNLYMNGGNYSLYILQAAGKDYSNMQYQIDNVRIGSSARYGKTSIGSSAVGNLVTKDIQEINQLYVGSVFKQNGKLYVSVTNDSSEARTLRIVTDKEEKEFMVERCWDGTSQDSVEYSTIPVDRLFELNSASTVTCYDGENMIGVFQFSE